jgi:hypothetical protein
MPEITSTAKLVNVYNALKTTGALQKLVQWSSTAEVWHPSDDKERISVHSNDVMKLVRKQYRVKDCWVRVSFPADATYGALVKDTTLELYALNKTALGKPIPFLRLDEELADAIHAELYEKLREYSPDIETPPSAATAPSITRDEASELYKKHWDEEFTTLDALLQRIRTLATAGAYELCVYLGDHAQYDEVRDTLSGLGFDVEHYNGGNNGILSVSWG